MISANPRAVVTGAAGGLGRSLAKRLAERGGHIVIADIDLGGAEETARIVERAGGKAHVERCDVSKAADVERLRDRSEEVLGAIDLIVNNAGVAVGGPVGEIPLADWDWIVGINLMGVIYGCHFFLPAMKKRGSGHILNVASIAGVTYAPQMGPYNATKAGVVALTETLAAELNKTGVGATVLCPYFFETNIHRAARAHTDKVSPDAIEKLMRANKVGADDVAAIALRACDKNEVFCFPHKEAKMLQALKRVSPGLIRSLFPTLEKLARG
ncbi:MAG: SDR family NAD(P)-dependent oxidoreductase [Polyangiaceae bacterium]|nr:SDR family NAD(P)-dependent oxidoreductase [Polyangiaceae bacterium]